ncbi:MAG: site-2 protease family protein [Coriobacteriales bacterium]|nr:site-2 protease family protein [Coriobacteriales bacterium]
MTGFSFDRVLSIALSVLVVLVATVFHEMAHAAAANALGDPTAKNAGRLTLNPIAHLDPVGSVLLPLLMALAGGPIFAFAKPVPYNPNRLRNPVRGEVLVALAGPACNLVQALVGSLAFRALYASFDTLAASPEWANALLVLLRVLYAYVYLNLMLMFFNLIPLPPLDGSAIVFPLLKGKARTQYYQVQRYALPVLMAVLYLVPMVLHVDPVGMYLDVTAGNLSDVLLGI